MPSPKSRTETPRTVIQAHELGIDPNSGEGDLFRWFLASFLFGKRIRQETARQAWDAFMAHGLDTPERILDAGWQGLVDVLDEGHYVRYDESTAGYLLDTCRLLLARYGGRVTDVLVSAEDAGEVTKRLKQFRGVGPVTTEIFLRDVDLRTGGDRAAGRQPITLGRKNLECQTARELRERARLLRIQEGATMSKQALVDSLAPYYAKE